MADQALQNAYARREAVMAKLEKVTSEINAMIAHHGEMRSELAKVDDFIRQWHEMAGIQPPQAQEQKKADAPADGGKRIRPRNPERRLVAEQCVYYIRQAGRPLMRKHLMERLTADGIEIRGKDPAMVLSTMLWRSKDMIRRLKGGGYWPAEDQVTPEVSQDLEDIMGSPD